MRNLLLLAALLLIVSPLAAAPVVPLEERTPQVGACRNGCPLPSHLQPHGPPPVIPTADGPPAGSEYDPAYKAYATDDGDIYTIHPAPVYQLRKTYIDIDVIQGGGEINITSPAFDVRPGERFIAAGEIVIRFVNPVDRSCKGACGSE